MGALSYESSARAKPREGRFGSFSPMPYMSPFGAILPCEQGPTEGACQEPTNLSILGSDMCDSQDTTIKAPAWVPSKNRPAVERVRAGT
jgi:hypothetical protein